MCIDMYETRRFRVLNSVPISYFNHGTGPWYVAMCVIVQIHVHVRMGCAIGMAGGAIAPPDFYLVGQPILYAPPDF